jgi:hypothetical protein
MAIFIFSNILNSPANIFHSPVEIPKFSDIEIQQISASFFNCSNPANAHYFPDNPT